MNAEKYKTEMCLSFDSAQYNGRTRDLKEFTSMLNSLFLKLIKAGFITPKDINQEIAQAAATFDATPIIALVSTRYEKEAKGILYGVARNYFLRGKEEAEAQITDAINEFKEDYKRNELQFYRPHQEWYSWRLEYLTVEDGYVSFDQRKLKRDCEGIITSSKQADFLNRAKALYDQIVAFDKECRLLSNDHVRCLGYNSVICCYNEGEEISFAPEASFVLNFE